MRISFEFMMRILNLWWEFWIYDGN